MADFLILTEGGTRAVLDGVDVSDIRITVNDVMKTGHCVSGAGRWFEGQGLSWHDFVRHGALAPALLKSSDAFAVGVVRKRLERENGRSTDQ